MARKTAIKSSTKPFHALSATQWQDLAAIEAEAHLDPWNLTALQNFSGAGHTALVLLIDDQVAGYIVLMHAVDDWELLNITVAPELHALGLGQTLLTAGIDAAQAASMNSVFLEVRPSNIAARALYEKNDFIAFSLRKNYYKTSVPGVYEDALLLRLTLSQTP